MKKLILPLLLFCGTITAQTTYQQVSDLINQNLASGSKITAVKHREVEKALLDFSNQNSAQQYDIKAIYANSTYLGNNFESDGLGKNLRAGWAICNGNNGTPNLSGRMIVSYGGDFTILNEEGGSKTHTLNATELPQLDVNYTGSNADNGGVGNFIITTDIESNGTKTLKTTGGGLAHNNMPPYKVLVYIMKL